MKNRCEWCLGSEQYIQYHDREWGVPVHDDQVQYEYLILEGAQAGLSWSTILNRREGYRRAFANFQVGKVASFDTNKVQELLEDEGIIRNKLKVRSAVTNAQKFIQIQEVYGSFSDYIWSFANGKPLINHWKSRGEIPATTKESDALSNDLKKRGFSFVGSTIMYAHMQATGLVNDHVVNCFRYQEIIEGYQKE